MSFMATAGLAYTLFPAGAALAGVVAATVARPNATVASAIQHFAAGVVFAAAAGEILPDVMRGGSAWPTIIGGSIGVVAMLLVDAHETPDRP